MFYEHHSKPVVPFREWLKRLIKSVSISCAIVSVALLIGIICYHEIGHLGWVDAFLEASMILGGMGPVAPLTNDAVKIFAGFYALFSGLVLLSTMGIILAPIIHRMLHLHLSKK